MVFAASSVPYCRRGREKMVFASVGGSHDILANHVPTGSSTRSWLVEKRWIRMRSTTTLEPDVEPSTGCRWPTFATTNTAAFRTPLSANQHPATASSWQPVTSSLPTEMWSSSRWLLAVDRMTGRSRCIRFTCIIQWTTESRGIWWWKNVYPSSLVAMAKRRWQLFTTQLDIGDVLLFLSQVPPFHRKLLLLLIQQCCLLIAYSDLSVP